MTQTIVIKNSEGKYLSAEFFTYGRLLTVPPISGTQLECLIIQCGYLPHVTTVLSEDGSETTNTFVNTECTASNGTGRYFIEASKEVLFKNYYRGKPFMFIKGKVVSCEPPEHNTESLQLDADLVLKVKKLIQGTNITVGQMVNTLVRNSFKTE